ncbi:tripartite ATP-independent transporter solute receptor, DctP family [Palleronia marisminoris]|uniref:2,3-diketo-L-gulonate-binding periplasmic protein YiaO n=1 Tax=Palleronia marisminoris TaxID=315423 RepID=A0A1Y5SA26_9RHOB|nr:TRAP transporter substrate-binding protein [Palleronia marisminoris]SFG70505.1 tripartite ATP-independent transporter solute receptor, DctP family [Palleronia marisminoris]SLN35962.1 2,3-diketo-L-gulonate-binding periplasmic protein YiaO precursor [Palleronia marisminoris]
MLRRSFFATAAAATFATAVGAAPEDFADMDPVTLRLAHVVNEQDGFHVAAEQFRDLVAERTGGKVTVEIFPNATLGDERTLLEGMQIGSIDMGVITNGPVSNFLPEMAVFELPFLFPSNEVAYEVLDGEVGQELLDRLENVNLKGLAYAERGFRNLTNSVRPVASPADMDGLRIRVMENPVYIDTFRELGANAIPMAWTEALTAMQQDTIDGQENPVGVVHSFKLDETQDYMTMTRHSYAPAIFVMGMAAWNKVPEEAQDVLIQSAQDAAAYERQFNADMETQLLDELRERGMEIDTDPDLTSFKEQIAPVYEQYGDQFGDLLERIQAQTN